MTTETPKLVFIDTETTSLNRRTRQAWDVGYLMRPAGAATSDLDLSRQFFIDVDLSEADPISLRIGGYFERHPAASIPPLATSGSALSPADAAAKIERDTRGAILVGAVPNFDEETLANLLYAHGLCPTWHYHLVDVETLAAGVLGMKPKWNFDVVLDAFGLTYDEKDRHTTLGDARMVRNLYDAVYARTTS